jgi:hypothetical protein
MDIFNAVGIIKAGVGRVRTLFAMTLKRKMVSCQSIRRYYKASSLMHDHSDDKFPR